MGYPMYYTSDGVRSFSRSGARHAAIAPYGPFASADGEGVFLGVQSEREWKVFCNVVLDKPALASDVRFDSNAKRVANLEVLHREITAVFEGLSSDAIIALLEKAAVAYGRLNSVQQFADHPQLQARGRWTEVGSPVGQLPAMIPPVTMMSARTRRSWGSDRCDPERAGMSRIRSPGGERLGSRFRSWGSRPMRS